jgi:hypothetical protein
MYSGCSINLLKFSAASSYNVSNPLGAWCTCAGVWSKYALTAGEGSLSIFIRINLYGVNVTVLAKKNHGIHKKCVNANNVTVMTNARCDTIGFTPTHDNPVTTVTAILTSKSPTKITQFDHGTLWPQAIAWIMYDSSRITYATITNAPIENTIQWMSRPIFSFNCAWIGPINTNANIAVNAINKSTVIVVTPLIDATTNDPGNVVMINPSHNHHVYFP